MLHTHLRLHVAVTGRTNGGSLGTFVNVMLYQESGSLGLAGGLKPHYAIN